MGHQWYWSYEYGDMGETQLGFDSYITQRMIIIHILLICKWCFALHFSNLNPIYDIKEIGYGFGMDFGSNIRWILAQWSKYTDKKCNKKLKFLSTYLIEIFLNVDFFVKPPRQWEYATTLNFIHFPRILEQSALVDQLIHNDAINRKI